MALDSVYGQHHYVGEYANDAAATTFVQAQDWDTGGDGTGTPKKGMLYFNTTEDEFRVWDGTAWQVLLTKVDADTLYYLKTAFLSSSTGVGDAGKPIVLDAAGKLDSSLIDASAIDHGGLSGKGDDDHPQYSLADGTRAFTGVVAGVTPTSDNHLTTKAYVDQLKQGSEHQDSVISRYDNTTALPSGSLGDRYIAQVTANGWTADNIYEWDGAAWVETVVEEGFTTWVDGENRYFHYTGTAWVKGATVADHNDLSGLQGGQAGEYYHLTSAQHTGLTGGGTSTGHNHDDRYGRVYSGTANPNGSQTGILGDIYVKTTNNLKYMNVGATSNNDQWQVI